MKLTLITMIIVLGFLIHGLASVVVDSEAWAFFQHTASIPEARHTLPEEYFTFFNCDL